MCVHKEIIIMVGLIIALCLLPVRRTSGQNAVVSMLGSKTVPLQSQLQPSPVSSLPATPEPKLSTNIQTENHVNLPSATVGDGPKPLFISRVTPERMADAQPRNRTAQNVTDSRNGSDADRIVFIEDDEENRVTPSSKAPPRQVASTNGLITPTTAAVANATQVELDERSSFDGDQCPTGFVKVNGKCVEAD